MCNECNDMGFATRANTSNEGEELDGLKIAVSSKTETKKDANKLRATCEHEKIAVQNRLVISITSHKARFGGALNENDWKHLGQMKSFRNEEKN